MHNRNSPVRHVVVLFMLSAGLAACAACGPNLSGDDTVDGGTPSVEGFAPQSPAQRDGGMLPCEEDPVGCGEEYPEGPGGTGSGGTGTGPTITKSVECFGVLYPYGPASSVVFVKHNVTNYSTGAVATSCFVSFSGNDVTSGAQHAAGSYGAAHGACSVANDIDAPSGGVWNFAAAIDRATTSVTYSDPSSYFNGWPNDVTCSVK